jgi:hypothetical protein
MQPCRNRGPGGLIMARIQRGLGLSLVCLAVVASAWLLGTAPREAVGEDAQHTIRGTREARVILTSQKPKTSKKKSRGKRGIPKPATPAEEKATPGAGAADGTLKFSRDIAPILVGNCTSCHNEKPQSKKIKLDMTTFEKLMAGTPAGKVIVPGKPEESHLVLRIKGEESPKMPQGANRTLTEASIAKIEEWVKGGAVLDAGLDPKKPIASYASSPDDLRKNDLAKLAPEARDKLVEAAGLARWKKANPKATPEVISGAHFLMFSTIPKERANAALKAVESQFTPVKGLLGAKAVEWGEKGSLFVFSDTASFVEFVRANENREVEKGDTGTAKFSGPQPYVAVIDPSGGRDEAASATKKAVRSKRGEEDGSGGGDRTLAGVLTEQFVIGAAAQAGKPPRWVSLGLGALVAMRIERGSAYYTKIRRDAFQLAEQGWQSKANEALGDGGKSSEVRAVGFAILEWLGSVERALPAEFVGGMLAGGDKLDEVIATVLNGTRVDFLAGSGEFIANRYGR